MSDNIIDIAEAILRRMNVSYCRSEENQITIDLSEDYTLSLVLRPDEEILHLSNDLGLKCPKSRLAVVADAIMKANERIWVGHFDLLSSSNSLYYSLSLPLINSFMFDDDTFESLLALVCKETDRFYHYFKMLVSNKKIPDFSVSYLLQDALGEA